MTYFFGGILVFWLAVVSIGKGLAWIIQKFDASSSQLIKMPAKVKLKEDSKAKSEALIPVNNKPEPMEELLNELRIKKEAEINRLGEEINRLEPLEGKLVEMTASREQLESDFKKVIAEKEGKISRLESKAAELESLPSQLKKSEASRTVAKNQLHQRTASFKKQAESFQTRIRKLEKTEQLADTRLVSLTRSEEIFKSFRIRKADETRVLKENLIRLEHLLNKQQSATGNGRKK